MWRLKVQLAAGLIMVASVVTGWSIGNTSAVVLIGLPGVLGMIVGYVWLVAAVDDEVDGL